MKHALILIISALLLVGCDKLSPPPTTQELARYPIEVSDTGMWRCGRVLKPTRAAAEKHRRFEIEFDREHSPELYHWAQVDPARDPYMEEHHAEILASLERHISAVAAEREALRQENAALRKRLSTEWFNPEIFPMLHQAITNKATRWTNTTITRWTNIIEWPKDSVSVPASKP